MSFSVRTSNMRRTAKTIAESSQVARRCYSFRTRPSTAYTAITHPETHESIPEHVQKELDSAKRSILGVYARPPLILESGKGRHVWDTQGRKYLDFTAGVAVNALGHADEEFVQAMTKQAAMISHSSNVFYNTWATRLAELLISLTRREGGLGYAPGATSFSPGAKVFFSNSGTEANEGALKIARKVGKERWAFANGVRDPKDVKWDDPNCTKFRVACFENAFHGRSMGSLSATSNKKYQAPFGPLLPGFDVGKVNDIKGLEKLITQDTCAVIVEPIQGEGGIFVVEENWLRAVRERCNEVGAVLIYDEIQCGLFRTGSMWAHSNLPVDCHPDIVTMAKPLANGFPIGAVMLRERLAETMTPGSHGTTFGGSPLACALGHHVLSRISAPAFTSALRSTAEHLSMRLGPYQKWFPNLIADEGTRGRGLMLGIPFRKEKSEAPGELVRRARERGVLLLTAGSDAVRLVPSLNVSTEEVDVAADVIESVLGEMSK